MKYLSHTCPGHQVHLVSQRCGLGPDSLPGLFRGGVGVWGGGLFIAHRLAFVFLFISRLVCLGGCFSPNTRKRRYKSAPACFSTSPDAFSVPDTALSSECPDPFSAKEATCPSTHLACGSAVRPCSSSGPGRKLFWQRMRTGGHSYLCL